ncbi:HEC/Ndc80p family protein-like protein [Pseudovirgaria hyperparasitica]|uniref:Kinetochore protein NDC80 n=1 Tax=Pseudovirgaria hyperparasitica TaxID=470096 RepID=A0A6A6WG79_9PEZI|nr:HEC/Ndc80p family protein-like protein [Pseudovirgaria hyperparasitica]KAF2760956.1 HEC/Ndc80p family protein-like protein [Pseudovirgaria hyperparasitica]
MALDGLFSARRPRETLGAVSQNANSSIPMPASAMKRSNSNSNLQQPPFTGAHGRSTSGSRMSLAPGMRPSQPVFHRSSSGNNLADMGMHSVQRTSTANMFSSAPGRKSFAPGGNMVAQTPASAHSMDQSAQRRSSVFKARSSSGMGAQASTGTSFFQQTAASSAVTIQDPRRLRDASVRHEMAHQLTEYLTQNNFEMDMKYQLSPKAMTSPTQKDFIMMFQWLYRQIDPSYRFQKNIDAEVPPLLTQMRYPFARNISKSSLTAVGGNNWFTFLGMLHWMMQLAQMMQQYATGAFDHACAEAGFDVSGDRIIFDFLSDAYRTWLQMDDDDEDDADKLVQPHVEQMAAKFEQANEYHLEQMKMLEAEHKALQDQIDELTKDGPRMAKLEEQIKVLEEDRVKFEKYNNTMEDKVARHEQRVQLLSDEIEKTDRELEEVERERSTLQDMVDKQGLTIADIDKMNAERERLQKGVETFSVRLEESKKRLAEKEMEASTKLDELELVVEKYNALGYQIAVIPSTAANAKGQDYELILTVNEGPDFRGSQMGSSNPGAPESDRLLADSGNGYQAHHLLNLDIKGTVRNNITQLRKEIRERRNQALEADIENHDILDKVKEAMDERQAEVETLGHKVRAAEEEFEKTKEITQVQKMNSDAQIERMEKELAKMRAGLGESLQLMEQREMNTNIAYEQLTLRAAALREELHTEIERMLNDVIRFKVHVQKSLEDHESFIAEQVSAELEEQDLLEGVGGDGLEGGGEGEGDE